jgi:type II secretory pathway pseudopilin PulG
MLVLKCKKRGFTLLGVLFILLVVTAVSLYAAIQFQQRAKIQKVQFTAMQIHNILEGLLSFYLVDQNWPAQLSYLYDRGYISENVLCSPWVKGSSAIACASNIPGASSTLAGYTLYGCSPSSTTCGVDITLPDNSSAKMLKNTLDGSVLSGTTVYTYVQAPMDTSLNRIVQIGQTMDANYVAGYVLMENGTFCPCDHQNDASSEAYKCRNSKGDYKKNGERVVDKCDMANVPIPSSCPTGSSPQIFVAPFGLNADVGDWGNAGTLATYQIRCDKGPDDDDDKQNCDCDYQSDKATTESTGWRIESKWTTAGGAGAGTHMEPISFFVACIENNRWEGHPRKKGWECRWENLWDL